MNQIIKFVRKTYTDNSTIGDVIVDGSQHCFYLEPTCRSIPGKIQAMPSGIYEVVMFDSPKARKSKADWPKTFGYKVPLLLKVPGHDFIECHPGNFPEDTHDCLCPGYSVALDYVGESVNAWKDLTQIIVSKLAADRTFFEIIGGLS